METELGELGGCWAKIWERVVICWELSFLARSIWLSAASCCSQGPAAARRAVKDATEMGLHCCPPPAAIYTQNKGFFYRLVAIDVNTEKKGRTQACSHFAVDSAVTCAMRFSRMGVA